MKIQLFIILLCINILSANSLYSQIKEIDDLYVDFSIPDNSAFKLLNVKEEAVSRPGNLKEFSIHFLNLVTSGSNISQGLAIEWAPLYTTTKSIKKYKDIGIIRNLSVSFATERSNIDSNGTDVALGLSIMPINSSDPLLNSELENDVNEILSKNPAKYDALIYKELTDQKINTYDKDAYSKLISSLSVFNYKDNSEKINTDHIIETFNEDLQKANQTLSSKQKYWLKNFLETKYLGIIKTVRSGYSDEFLSKLLKEKLDDFKKKSWNARVLQLNIGTVFNSNNSTWKKLSTDRFSGFISYADGISSWGQIIINAQAFWSAQNDNEVSNKYLGGARFIAGNSDIRGSIEFIYSSTKKRDISEKDNKLKAALGFELKLTDGVWLETAIGVENLVNDFNESSIISLANFKYTFKKVSRYFKN